MTELFDMFGEECIGHLHLDRRFVRRPSRRTKTRFPEPSQRPCSAAEDDFVERPLRAVHVGPCFVRGGSEQHLIDLIKFLDPQKLMIERCLVVDGTMIDPDVAADMPVPVCVASYRDIQEAASGCDLMLFWGVKLDRILGDVRPPLCVFLAHGDSDWTREMLSNSRNVTDHVIAVSRLVKERVCAGCPATVITNGVDAARLASTCSRAESRELLGFDENDFVVGFVGRFSSEKRLDRIIEALTDLPREYKLLAAGWGPLRPDLLELANWRIPGRFTFTRAGRYLGDIYQAMDVLCLVSEYEGFGLVALEAMMCGLPVVATSVGVVPDSIIDRVNGLIIDGSIDSIRKALTMLSDHPDWAAAVGREAARFAHQRGHARRMAREYEALLHRLWRERNTNRD